MFAKLVVVNRIHNEAGEPVGLRPAFGHASLRKFPKGIAVLLGSLCGDLQRAFGARVVRSQQDPAIGFHRENAIAGFQAEPVGHVLRQRCTDGTTRLAKRYFLGHS